MRKFKNSFEAYWWVHDHPKLEYDGFMAPWIEMTPHMVNAKTNSIDDNSELNTKQQWWIEAGPYVEDEFSNKGGHIGSHDWNLDCGGDSIDEAILKLAKLVEKHYGDYDA